MHTITVEYLSRAQFWMAITTLVYFMMNGAQIFETILIVPKWTENPPHSFKMLEGKYGRNLKAFWIAFHSLHEITFVLAIVFCWNLEIRNWLCILFAIHFAVRAWTILYFAPNIIEFQNMTNKEGVNLSVVERAATWKQLNYWRVGIFVAVSLGLVYLIQIIL